MRGEELLLSARQRCHPARIEAQVGRAQRPGRADRLLSQPRQIRHRAHRPSLGACEERRERRRQPSPVALRDAPAQKSPLEAAPRRKPAHPHEPVDDPCSRAQRKSSGARLLQCRDPQIHRWGEPPVQLQFGAARPLPVREGAVVHRGLAHGLLQLQRVRSDEKYPRVVRLDAPDRAWPRRVVARICQVRELCRQRRVGEGREGAVRTTHAARGGPDPIQRYVPAHRATGHPPATQTRPRALHCRVPRPHPPSVEPAAHAWRADRFEGRGAAGVGRPRDSPHCRSAPARRITCRHSAGARRSGADRHEPNSSCSLSARAVSCRTS